MLVRIPVSWLRDLVPIELPLGEVAHMLTMAGIETEVHLERGEDWANMWVGRVAKLEKHPKADKLLLATVDYGHGTKTVVTGAPNLAEGDVVPYAEAGAFVLDEAGKKARLEPRALRGVKSEGMVLSERELGIGPDHDGIHHLDRSLAPGTALAEALGEAVFHCELSPNRSDCLGVIGIAREVAALTTRELREPALDPFPPQEPEDFRVTIEDPEGCPRYDAVLLRQVRVGPSPEWMQRRLLAAGMRPINNVVDVTNYVMLEVGQPLHAFDRARLRGGEIRVRRARRGETLRTLDGVDRVLDAGVLVIADAERPVAIAGIIGGEDSEISERTTDVVLEVASFEHRGIGRTATALGLHGSEASAAARRFAWELSRELVPYALRRAVRLLREVAGAEATAALDVYPDPKPVANVRMPFGHFRRVLGAELPRDDVLDALRRVGCRYALDGEVLVVTPPPWRVDVTIPEDVVEEAARIIGYDRIPIHIPAGPLPLHERHPDVELRERARDALVSLGLQEIVSYSLIDPHWLEMITLDGSRFGPEPLRVTNPTSEEQSVARTTLEPSLLDTARRNLKWVSGVALFEIDPVYLPRPRDLPEERWTIGIVLAGRNDDAPRHWLEGPSRPFDYHDLAALVEGLSAALGLTPPELDAGAAELHPGRSAQAREGDRVVVRMGQLHPTVAERWELPAETFVALLDLPALLGRQTPLAARLPSRFPPAMRDLAVEVEESVSWGGVRDEVRSAAGKHLVQVTLLDLYRGPQLGAGKKSFAMRLVFQSDDATLAEEEIERQMRRIAGRLERALGATLRA